MIELDHIAVAGPTLADCADAFQQASGLALPMGGEHAQMGTHNRLCQLQNDTYLELIAVNPDAPAPDRPLWFGLDAPPNPPRMTAWLLRTDNLATALETAKAAGVDLGHPTPFHRGDLRWLFSLRDDGQIPLGGAAPMIIEWQTPGPHPSRSMADLGLSLRDLTIETPQADALQKLCDAIGLQDRPTITQSPDTRICAALETAQGNRFQLS